MANRHRGEIEGVFDKAHLVPFGEFQPNWFPLNIELVPGGGFVPGSGAKTLHPADFPPVGPLICYEAIFPGEGIPRDQRPGWLLNLTNDAWFGISSGPYQHFHQARVQAIAEGLPLVRAANNGISAVVDPLGRVVNSLSLGGEGVIDSALPAPVESTTYASLGDRHIQLVLALIFSLVTIARYRRRA